MSITLLRPLLQAALDYARRGWHVFPAAPRNKVPAISKGFYAATTNPATINRWWQANPQYNIAIRCGAWSNLLVLDRDDGKGGGDALAQLVAKHGPLPQTLEAETAHGAHLYFTTNLDLPCSVGKIGQGLDIRCRGGYVIAPPSRHPHGPTYRWRNDLEPARPPQWLIDLARKQTNSERALDAAASPWSPPRDADAYGKAALVGEVARVAAAPQGTRNYQLNFSAFRLAQLAAIDLLAMSDVVGGLLCACERNGLLADDGRKQCLATIMSGIKAGAQFPRRAQS